MAFFWKRGAQIIGRLSVPKGGRLEVYDYFEGIVTTLHYQDGAYIKLQAGGMYRLPLFSDPEYVLFSTTKSDTKTVRAGRCGDGKLNWREDNYKPKKSNAPRHLNIFLWPPNIGYANVTSERKSEFDKALDSFILTGTPSKTATLTGHSASPRDHLAN